MAGPSLDSEDKEKPLDPAVERVRRKLVRFVAINLGLLFLALMAVVAAIVYRAGRSETPPPPSVSELPVPDAGGMIEGEIALPQGARVLGHAVSAGRISLDVEMAGGARAIFIYDTAQARIIGRFDIVTGR